MSQTAREHIHRIGNALERYSLMNHRPAVDEPANDFERHVNQWYEKQQLIAEIKKLLKPLDLEERKDRVGTGQSIATFLGDKLKEGVNKYELSNLRVLKYTHKVDRKIDPTMVNVARAEFVKAGDIPQGLTFDDLLRTKYELAATPYKKLDKNGAAAIAFSRCMTTKFAAPTLEVD
jgi:hypothetical protein